MDCEITFKMTTSVFCRTGSSGRRPFTAEEDVRLLEIVGRCQMVNWESIAHQMGARSSRQCRERWVNYLNPQIRNDPWTEDEDMLLLDKINELGHSWAQIGRAFNGRSESDVKNRWYSHIKGRCSTDPGSGLLKFTSGQDLPRERKKRSRAAVKADGKENQILNFWDKVTVFETEDGFNFFGAPGLGF
jgi:hypothetical protein